MIMPFCGETPKIAQGCFIAPNASLIGKVDIGEDSSVWFSVVIRADVNSISIGKRTNIQDLSMIHVTHASDGNDGYPTIIGDDVTIAHKVMLHGCTIEDACLIGMNATILDGAIIGKESIVGANSLVTKNKKFPPRSLILGNPAKVVRSLSEEEIASLYTSAKNYIQYKNSYM
jgi:carbonic anhydrase/acetyltransferase-like protein (isoleucine patch superfamily)